MNAISLGHVSGWVGLHNQGKRYRLSNSQVERSFVLWCGCYLQDILFGTFNVAPVKGFSGDAKNIEVVLGRDLARSLTIDAGVRSRHVRARVVYYPKQYNPQSNAQLLVCHCAYK